MHIEFSHFLIRNYRAEDERELHGILSDPLLMKEMEHTYSRAETGEFLRQYGLAESASVYALEDTKNGKLAGHIIWHPYDGNSYEAGWIIHPAYQGKGLAQRCTAALMTEGAENGISSVTIECTAANAIAGHIIEKLGFRFDGTEENGLLVFRKDL